MGATVSTQEEFIDRLTAQNTRKNSEAQKQTIYKHIKPRGDVEHTTEFRP